MNFTSTTNSSVSAKPTGEQPAVTVRLKRWSVRLFFMSFVIALAIDTAPTAVVQAPRLKTLVWPLLTRLGLWQGQWTLFAPNPKINNAWLSAEVYRPDGSQQQFWNSTYWADTSSWERFAGFRHINYNNRLQTQGPEAANALADYLARQLIRPTARPVNAANAVQATAPHGGVDSTASVSNSPVWRLVLSRNELNICLPADGSLPTRDETVWLSASQNLAVREYQP